MHRSVVLKRGSRDIERKIRTVNNTLHGHQEFRYDFFDVIGNEDLVVVQLDLRFQGVILRIDLREIKNALQVERIVHIEVDPEKRFFIIVEYLSVKCLIFVVRAVLGHLGPKRMDIIDRLRYRLLMRLRYSFAFLDCLVCRFLVFLNQALLFVFGAFLRVFSGIFQINSHRHERAVFFQDFAYPVFIAEFIAAVIEEKRNLRSDFRAASVVNRIFRTAVALPMHRFRIRKVGKRVDVHLVRYHEG